MKKVLVLYTSPTMKTKKGSISTWMAKEFINEYITHHKDEEIIYMDLNEERMASKAMTTTNFDEFFNEKDSDYYINQLKDVDKLVIAAPMINFNYPAILKNYLDHILVANKTFKYKYKGNGESEGLLKNLKVQILSTQGAEFGWYPWGNVASMLEGTFKFMGAKISPSLTIYGVKTPHKIVWTVRETVESVFQTIKNSAAIF